MTIRIEHLTIEHSDAAWISAREIRNGGVDVLADESYLFDFLATVRHIMRERGDCRFIPRVVAAVKHHTNEWGHDMTVEVNYAGTYHAVYGVRLSGNGVESITCYMD